MDQYENCPGQKETMLKNREWKALMGYGVHTIAPPLDLYGEQLAINAIVILLG